MSENENSIQPGDTVYVQIDASDHVAVRGIVVRLPCATGDALVIKGKGGMLHYIQQYYVMTREKGA